MNDSASSANEMAADDELLWQTYRFVSGEMSPTEASAFEQQLERDLEAGNLRLCELVTRMTELSHAVVAAESTQPATIQPETIRLETVQPATAKPETTRPAARPAAASAGTDPGARATSRIRKVVILVAGGAVAAALFVAFLAGPQGIQQASVPPSGLGHEISEGRNQGAGGHQRDVGNQATRLVSLWRAADDEEGEDATGDELLVEHEAVDHEAAFEHEPGVDPDARRSRVARSDYSVPVWLLAAVTPEAGDGMPESAVKPAGPMPGPSPESRPQEN